MLSLANSTKIDLHSLGSQEPAWRTECKSANDWFCKRFPTQVKVFGSPFLEQHQGSLQTGTQITPLVPNLDFLAACLGGDESLGHRVIYYPAELQFYYYDPRNKMFHATTPEKLGNLLRGLLARCAAEVSGEAHILNLFHTFRADQVVKSVVNRCKSVLAADSDFFGVKSPHQRVQGPEIHERLARVFAEQMLEPCPNSILTVGQTYALFNQFTKARNMPALKRSLFKGLFAEVIREAYDLGLRNDLVNAETQTQQRGWKGLRPVEREAA
jgi:hypothetical protein